MKHTSRTEMIASIEQVLDGRAPEIQDERE